MIITDTTVNSKKMENSVEFMKFLGRDNDDIEIELFGAPAVDCLKITDVMIAERSGDNLSLAKALSIKEILKKYKGIYSVR